MVLPLHSWVIGHPYRIGTLETVLAHIMSKHGRLAGDRRGNPRRLEKSRGVKVQVVVVGAGACGLIAALAARDAGAEVLVLERDASPPARPRSPPASSPPRRRASSAATTPPS